ncbi:MAG: sodium-dependent transporter [Desulfovibrionaceae bacterium]|nr:sodium-dependent transporter [Desulfovibrionaceae bacterium]
MNKRETWGSRTGFILAAVGSAIGLGNIWRFPYMVFENGGGAFLLPYFTAMLLAGIPFMMLEFGLGHKFRGSAPKIFASISRRAEWLGWWQTLVAFVIACYYVIVIAWTVDYFLFSFTQAWTTDPKGFFFGQFLGLTDSPLHLGGVRWPILGAAVFAWLVAFLAVFTGIRKGIERANKIFMPLLFILVLVFIGRGILLDGAAEGLNWLFRPDFSALSNGKVWADAFGQIFFSLSVGFAIMLSYSSYLPKDSDVTNNACMTVFINCGFSLLAGIMIFSVLGYMAAQQGVAVKDVVSSGVGLAFITLPTAINLMPMPVFFGVLFFLALMFAGLTSMISITEAVVAAVKDKAGMSRQKAAILVCGVGFVGSTAFTTGGGLLLLDIVDHFVNNFGILLGGFVELVFVGWFCNLESLREYINEVSDFPVTSAWNACLRFVTPLMMGIILISNFIEDLGKNYGGYTTQAVVLLGWAMLFAMLVLSVAFPRWRGDFRQAVTVHHDFRNRRK